MGLATSPGRTALAVERHESTWRDDAQLDAVCPVQSSRKPVGPPSAMTRRLAPLALALVLTLAHVRSQPERCFSRQHQNATVNARAALAGAGVAAASRSVPTEQECVLACCSQRVPPGAKCNVAVFNGNKRNGGEDNCFLYHCPNERDCPLTKAPPGTRTYDIFKGKRPRFPPAQPSLFLSWFPAQRADEMPKKQSKTKNHKKTKSEEAGPRTADKVPESAAPPTTTPAVGTPPPTTTTPPTTTVTTTPPAATSSPPPPTPTTTTPPPPNTATPPTATAATPPPRTAIAPTPPPTTKASASPPSTATTPPSSCLTTPAPLTFGSRRSQTSKVPTGAQNPRGPVSAGPGALKSGVVALLVAAAAVLTLALAVGGRKAMESFDRRHYTRLELNDLHYDL
uniref:MANSC domain-containing protein n=1 Tax=Hippocampus comes TaxID=109280 RepID=A0A3Q2XKF3_HIPCM